MSFYDLSKEDRVKRAQEIKQVLLTDLSLQSNTQTEALFSDTDTYIRKTAYIAIGRIHQSHPDLQDAILKMLDKFLCSEIPSIRQTVVNAAGEIGRHTFEKVRHFFDVGLKDQHHSVRNAVIGSIKKMSEVNPVPVLAWAREYLHHHDKEVRREICHGIELRGRTHPEDILPLLRELEFDNVARVKNTLVHVIGQISYKKGCLETVIKDLKNWENQKIVRLALDEILDVHDRYRDFSALTRTEAEDYIANHF